LYYILTQMGCFNIFHSLTFSFSLPPPIIPQTDLLIQFCSHYMGFVYIYKYIHMLIYLAYRHSFHM
jgi:hypothetical protein